MSEFAFPSHFGVVFKKSIFLQSLMRHHSYWDHYCPGASCSKLIMSLENDSLKFQTAILQIHCYFLLIKCENPKDSHILSTKNNSVFAYVVGIYLTS